MHLFYVSQKETIYFFRLNVPKCRKCDSMKKNNVKKDIKLFRKLSTNDNEETL